MNDMTSTVTKPEIYLSTGKRHEAADSGISALRRSHIYQRGPNLVRCTTIDAKTSGGTVTASPGIVLVCQPYLQRELSLAADWFKRSKEDEQRRRIDPPAAVAAQILSMQGLWPFEILTGVIGTPTMRPDGSLLLQPGYDHATGYYLLAPPPLPRIPDKPTEADARLALSLLKGLLVDFPFVDDASHSVALSAIMTPVLRAAMAVAPCHAASAPEAGSGKSYLFNTAAMIATGDLCPVISMTKGNPEEREKRLIGAVLSGHPIIAIDNLTAPLEGDFLCQITEQPRLLPRALGSSDMNAIPNAVTVFANGLNLTVAQDMAARRTLVINLDPDVDDTTKRTYTKPTAIEKIIANRGKYIAAVLTIARAYIVAETPGLLSLPSYDDWCKFVRSPLVWLGEPDPVATMEAARANDPQRIERQRVFSVWKEKLSTYPEHETPKPGDGTQITELKNHTDAGLQAALLEIASSPRAPNDIDTRILGNWLRRAQDTRIALPLTDEQRKRGDFPASVKLVSNKLGDRTRPRWMLLEKKKSPQP